MEEGGSFGKNYFTDHRADQTDQSYLISLIFPGQMAFQPRYMIYRKGYVGGWDLRKARFRGWGCTTAQFVQTDPAQYFATPLGSDDLQ